MMKKEQDVNTSRGVPMIDEASESISQPLMSKNGDALKNSESTAFHMWLLITVSSGIIMAQDTWISLQQPRLGTMDATASFTKVLVIHSLWLIVSIAFLIFTWKYRPTSAWRVHVVAAILAIFWTSGVLMNAFAGVETLRVSTWQCHDMPTESTVTEQFLESCKLSDSGSTIRMGGDIFLWSINDKHYWRWIVPGENMVTLQTRWPANVSAIFMASPGENAILNSGSSESIPGGTWSAGFDPRENRELRLFFIDSTSEVPPALGTPMPHESDSPDNEGG